MEQTIDGKLPLFFHKSCMYPYSTQHMYQQTQNIRMGYGQVFVEYADLQGAVKAKSSLHGRKFGGNTIVATYYPEEKLMHGDFGG
jgi:hypothetical protein